MAYKKRKIVAKNKFIYIFSSLYIIGLIFAVAFSGDAGVSAEVVRAGFEKVAERSWLYSVTELSMTFFSVSLVMWSFCITVWTFRVTSGMGVFIATVLGYSSGCASVIMLRGFPGDGMLYILLCIIPASLIRFFLWYALSVSGKRLFRMKDRTNNRYCILIFKLGIILFSDMFIAVMTVVFSKLLF